MELRKVTDGQLLEKVYALYQAAFPACERKPFSLILKKQEEGRVDVLALLDEEEFSGLAIMARDQDLILLDYLAIDEEKRGGGAGSWALAALQEYYPGLRMVIEIESTGKDVPDREMRLRRKEFYLRNGMTVLPFCVDCFGTEMEMLSNGTKVSFEEYWSIYENAFGSKSSAHIRLAFSNAL